MIWSPPLGNGSAMTHRDSIVSSIQLTEPTESTGSELLLKHPSSVSVGYYPFWVRRSLTDILNDILLQSPMDHEEKDNGITKNRKANRLDDGTIKLQHFHTAEPNLAKPHASLPGHPFSRNVLLCEKQLSSPCQCTSQVSTGVWKRLYTSPNCCKVCSTE